MPHLLHAMYTNDIKHQTDEKANITYLAELMKVMPELECLPSVQKDPKQEAHAYAAQHMDETLERLKELCACTPQQFSDAADKVLYVVLVFFDTCEHVSVILHQM